MRQISNIVFQDYIKEIFEKENLSILHELVINNDKKIDID